MEVTISNLARVFRFTSEVQLPNYTDYTMITLKTAYIIFWLIINIQFCVIYTSKLLTSKSFKESKLSKKLWHVLRCLLVPDFFSDWDEDLEDQRENMQEKIGKIKQEITIGCIINWIFLITNCIPLIVTGI